MKSENFKAAERTAQWVRVGARGICCPELFRVGDARMDGIDCAGPAVRLFQSIGPLTVHCHFLLSLFLSGS